MGITISVEINIGNREVSNHSHAIMINDATGVAFITERTGDRSAFIILDTRHRYAIAQLRTNDIPTPAITRSNDDIVDNQKSAVNIS